MPSAPASAAALPDATPLHDYDQIAHPRRHRAAISVTVSPTLSPVLSGSKEVSPLSTAEEDRLKGRRKQRKKSADKGQNWRQRQNVHSVVETSAFGETIAADPSFNVQISKTGAVVIGEVEPLSPAGAAEFQKDDVVSGTVRLLGVSMCVAGCRCEWNNIARESVCRDRAVHRAEGAHACRGDPEERLGGQDSEG